MTEEIKNDANEATQPEEQIMFTIAMNKNGQIGIGGIALGDKAVCYGLLEVAKDMLREMHTPKIQPVTNGGFRKFLANGR